MGLGIGTSLVLFLDILISVRFRTNVFAIHCGFSLASVLKLEIQDEILKKGLINIFLANLKMYYFRHYFTAHIKIVLISV